MEMKYFPDTDTLLINFTHKDIVETRDINENILIELDRDGQLVSKWLITNPYKISWYSLKSKWIVDVSHFSW
jgi:uncharacterized protein YuzE